MEVPSEKLSGVWSTFSFAGAVLIIVGATKAAYSGSAWAGHPLGRIRRDGEDADCVRRGHSRRDLPLGSGNLSCWGHR